MDGVIPPCLQCLKPYLRYVRRAAVFTAVRIEMSKKSERNERHNFILFAAFELNLRYSNRCCFENQSHQQGNASTHFTDHFTSRSSRVIYSGPPVKFLISYYYITGQQAACAGTPVSSTTQGGWKMALLFATISDPTNDPTNDLTNDPTR